MGGGARRGSDIAKAICLGARVVLIGSPMDLPLREWPGLLAQSRS
jgi:isopentenyl diphosphate isomerase/L-lactate dehydrogenase-like FMN-dependent dehydrogenase